MTLRLKLYLGGVEKATVSKMWPVVSDDNGEVAKRVPVFSICCLPVHDITGKPHHSVHFHMMLSLYTTGYYTVVEILINSLNLNQP